MMYRKFAIKTPCWYLIQKKSALTTGSVKTKDLALKVKVFTSNAAV